MGKVERLNVKTTTEKSRIVIGYHLATATLQNDEEIDVVGTGYGLTLQAYDRGKSVYISYEDIIKEALKVL